MRSSGILHFTVPLYNCVTIRIVGNAKGGHANYECIHVPVDNVEVVIRLQEPCPPNLWMDVMSDGTAQSNPFLLTGGEHTLQMDATTFGGFFRVAAFFEVQHIFQWPVS